MGGGFEYLIENGPWLLNQMVFGKRIQNKGFLPSLEFSHAHYSLIVNVLVLKPQIGANMVHGCSMDPIVSSFTLVPIGDKFEGL